MTAEVIRAIRTIAPRHTAKWMSRRWGRAVVTCKQWLKNGVPEYLLQTVLADLDKELERYERELLDARVAIRKARHEGTSTGVGGAAGAMSRQGSEVVRQDAEGRR